MLSCHPDGPSYLADGTTLANYVATHPGCLDTDCDKFDQFPILTKFIDAKGNLSIQVHPSNEYALKNEHQYGKPRALHIEKALDVTLRTPPVTHDFGGHLAQCEYFTVDAKKGAFDGAADEKSFVSLLITDGAGTLTCGGETVPIKKGESYFLPAGSGSYTVTGHVQTLVTTV